MAIRNEITARDSMYVNVTRTPGRVAHPCPKCGKGSRVTHTLGQRVCAARGCRHVFQAQAAQQSTH